LLNYKRLSCQFLRTYGLDRWVSCEKASRELGYVPVVTVTDGLLRCCKVLKTQPPYSHGHIRLDECAPVTAGNDLSTSSNTLFKWRVAKHCLTATMVLLTGGLVVVFWRRERLEYPTFTKVESIGVLGLVKNMFFTWICRQCVCVFADASTIPESTGYPVIGNALAFNSSPLTLCKQLAIECGEVFSINIFGKSVVFLASPAASEVMFKSTDEEVSQNEVYKVSVPLFGKGVIYDAELDVRQQQFYFCTQGFSDRHMEQYVPLIMKECELYFSNWKDEGVCPDFNKVFAERIINTASRCLMGKFIRDNFVKEMAHLYEELEQGLTYIANVAPYLPIPPHIRRDKARKKLFELFGVAIAEKRREGLKETGKDDLDILDILLCAKYRDGRAVSDEEICGLLVVLLFGGQHTTEKTSSWVMINILFNRERVMKDLLLEQENVSEVNYSAVSTRMEFLTSCIIESLRLHPPLAFVMRYVKKERKYKGHSFPPGTVLAVAPVVPGVSQSL